MVSISVALVFYDSLDDVAVGGGLVGEDYREGSTVTVGGGAEFQRDAVSVTGLELEGCGEQLGILYV